MSVNTRSPLRFLGGVNTSGNVNDGHMQMTQGGQKTYSAYSGGLITLGSGTTGFVSNPGTGQIVLASGPGRINEVFVHTSPTVATTTIYFYDSNVAALSGTATHAASGMAIVGTVPGVTLAQIPASGLGFAAGTLFNPVTIIGMPFANGLGASVASGAPGFTVSYTLSNEVYVGP